jgi:L-ascorbate metabolism protein UlaG (beta-lactamase superfamily)
LKIKYFGHSCFSVELNGKHLLFDPFITPNPLAADIDINSIQADYILLSHAHDDHTHDAIAIAKKTGAKIISNFEITEWAKRNGIDNVHPMNIGGSWIFDDLLGKVKCVNAVHSSSFADGSYGGEAMGFLIETEKGNFYFAGDTALTYDMKLIGEYKEISIAFLPIGGNFTMNVDNAIIASDFINCDQIIGMHFDTFGYITINKDEAQTKFAAAAKDLILMGIGEERNY